MKNIRNFAIIAHIDHGKSTLADRLLELTGTVEAGHHEAQMLDQNPISRERGITIKLAPVRMHYVGNDPRVVPDDGQKGGHGGPPLQQYVLNLIDTPGHVDFSYEVDRTLACVEGVVLLVDSTQGIQAQTIANAYKAIEKNLVIIPVVNKIDMANAEVEKTKKQLVDFLGIRDEEIYCVSAKTGEGVKNLLETIITKIPPPFGIKQGQTLEEGLTLNKNIQALIFDSYYDSHRGVIAFVRVFDGELKKGKKLRVKEVANMLANLVYANVRKYSTIQGITGFLLGGKDHEGFYLYEMGMDGSLTKFDDYVTDGSGMLFATGVLEANYKEELSIDDGVKLAIKAVSASMQRDTASEAGMDVITITKEGTKRVFSKQLDNKFVA